MYHKVSENKQDFLTVSVRQLEQQLRFLKDDGYRFVALGEVLNSLETNEPLPDKAVLVSFDDGYRNNLQWAVPVLEKYQVPATIYLPTAYIGKNSSWDEADEELMSPKELAELDPILFTFGWHSHLHQNYKHLSPQEIEQDLIACSEAFRTLGLKTLPVFAYPYGGRPKDTNIRKEMKQTFAKKGIKLAFRIGNRLNYWPPKDRYEINRIDIRGDDSFATFKRKVRFGKWV